ncbi:hypothetical protein HY214_04935 [Candidatus Roizmanbacteria bacterium]|nr:hypothetical protein [Candidatus Roizmanbacteria bacterium]
MPYRSVSVALERKAREQKDARFLDDFAVFGSSSRHAGLLAGIGGNHSADFPQFNRFDFHSGLELASVDVKFTKLSEYDVPLLDLSRLTVAEKTKALLIGPDAKEGTVEGRIQSSKSLPPATWRAVASLLPTDLPLDILRETAHPQYCGKVLEEIRSVRPEAGEVAAPDLNGFIEAVAGYGTYVGADSGTTHLAAEIAASRWPEAGDKVYTIYYSGFADVADYGVRGLGERGKILAYKAHYLGAEVDSLAVVQSDNQFPQRIADFILS